MVSRKFLLFFPLLLPVLALGSVSVTDVQKAIKQKQAGWIAGESWVTSMPEKTRINLLGAEMSENPEFVFESSNQSLRALGYPDHLDWRYKNGVNWMSPVTNQGVCGSCVAFATVGVFEGMTNIVNNWAGLNMDFSEQFLFACGGGGCNTGWYTSSGAAYLKKGIPDELCMPYKSGANGLDVSCSTACGDSASRLSKIRNYRSVSGYSLNKNEIIAALQNGPLLSRMTVYSDFMTYAGGVYEHVTGGVEGGHAIVLMGYDVPGNYWIVRNSWGTKWGEEGYFKIKMDDVSGVGPGSIALDMDPLAGAARIASPLPRQVVNGQYEFKLESSFAGTTGMKFRLKNATTNELLDAVPTGDGKTFTLQLDTSKYADGAYAGTSIAVVNTQSGIREYSSQPQAVHILNGEALMTVNLKSPLNGAVLKDKVYFEFNLSSTPVPIEKFSLRIKGADGQVFGGTNDTPDAYTKTSWRTYTRPDGEYEVWGEAFIGCNRVESNHIKVTVKNGS